jgi:N-acetylneuraminic acid mutarotase
MKKCIMIVAALLYSFICVNAVFADGGTWTQKGDFGGQARVGMGMSIGNKGYFGSGTNDGQTTFQDFWEYDPSIDTWTQKADTPIKFESNITGFVIGSKGYIGTGTIHSNPNFPDGDSKAFWEFDPVANTWTQKADFGGSARKQAVGFSIGNNGYIGSGWDGGGRISDSWKYDPATDTWTQIADFPDAIRTTYGGFTIGNKYYRGLGWDNGLLKAFWEYNPATDTWIQKADFGGGVRTASTLFTIGSKGYVGMGADDSSGKKDFWEYDPATDTWTQKTDFGGNARAGAAGFSIGNKGYVVAGYDGSVVYKDVWEYDPGDTTPDAFSFTDQTGVALNTVITSNTITVSGIDAATPISITGGTYSINGGAYTSASGTANNGDTVTLQLTSSGSYSTTANTTLTIGGISGTFSVTTAAQDTTPDSFSFTDQTGVALSTAIISNAITVSGINAAIAISVTGGTYSINGGAYTSASGTVNNGNTVIVKLTSSGSYTTTTNATLTIGGVSDTFSVTTAAKDTTPNSFSFTAQTGVALSTAITSNTITVSGINAAVSISITGGTYSIKGG